MEQVGTLEPVPYMSALNPSVLTLQGLCCQDLHVSLYMYGW